MSNCTMGLFFRYKVEQETGSKFLSPKQPHHGANRYNADPVSVTTLNEVILAREVVNREL